MKKKSDKKKLQEGRCLGEGSEYVGFLKANEAKSIGTSCAIWDPIAARTVDVLSMGEKEFFYIMRFRDDVTEIKEQMRLSQEIVEQICQNHGFRVPRHILSTDFLVTFKDGKCEAYSIKAGHDEFNRESPKYRNNPKLYERLLIRQYVEKEYWRMHGVDFKIVFREDLNKILALNIEQCLSVYDSRYITHEESMLRYLVAHKIIRIPMEQRRICFTQMVKGYEAEVRRLYERSCHGN